MPKNKLSLMAGRALPRFVKEEYPQFLNFIKGYFQYLERDGGEYTVVSEMLDSVDIDNTVDDYLFYFKNEYMPGFPDSMAVEARFIIKKIKDYYSAKGTESSFEFLFRTLFDSPVEFYYPKIDMLRVSDGAWILPYYLMIEKLDGQVNNPDLFELLDQKIQGKTSGATGYIDARLLLTVPTLADPEVILLKFGASVTELSGEFIAGEEVTVISSRIDEYGVALPEIPDFRIIETVESGSGIIQPAGRYADSGGFISWDKRIQDSYYYQDFSYELISEIPVKFYDEVIRRLVHPSGYMMFGKVEKKSIDIISLRDLLNSFEMLITWLAEVNAETTLDDARMFMTLQSDAGMAKLQHTDWNHFLLFKESDQYDTFRIDEIDTYTIAEMYDLESENFFMAFVNGKKIPAEYYTVSDDFIEFSIPPEIYSGSILELEQNVEIVELSYSLQDASIFTTDGNNVKYRLNDDLVISGNQYVMVFVDGLFQDNSINYNIETKIVGGSIESNIIFTSLLAAGKYVEVLILGNNVISGSNYAPARRYPNLSENDIQYNNPFPIPHMVDDAYGDSLMLFVNGRKIMNKTQYSIYYDIDAKSYQVLPRVGLGDLNLVAPYNVSTFSLRAAIMDIAIHKGDGVQARFPLTSNYNLINHTPSSLKVEHEYQSSLLSKTEIVFSRDGTGDTGSWSTTNITHSGLVNGSKVKVYFNVDINILNAYFNNYAIGIDGDLFTFDSVDDRIIATPEKLTYTFNRTFVVNDASLPLVIKIGQISGKVRNLTLSLIDD
jgi:hypothetical protein